MATWRKALDKLRQERRNKGGKPAGQSKSKDVVASDCADNSTTVSTATCDSTRPPDTRGTMAHTAPAGPLTKDLLIERTFAITDSVKQIRLYQDPSGILACGHGATIWDSALVLADYLQHRMRKYLKPQTNVLELGAGCGLAGIVASVLGARVTLTDIKQVLPLLNLNIKHNESLFVTPPGRTNIFVMKTWTSNPVSNFDIIIGADITYYLDTLSDLATVIDMASTSRTLVLLAHEHRKVDIDRKIEAAFANIQRKLVEVPREQLGPTYRGGAGLTLFELIRAPDIHITQDPVSPPVPPSVSASACSSASTSAYTRELRDALIARIRERPDIAVDKLDLTSMSVAELCTLADR